MEAICTANKLYNYDDKYNEITLDDFVQYVHKRNCEENKWKHTALKKGAFGYDNLCVTIGTVFNNKITKDSAHEDVAKWVHDGWIENYTYWRDNTPWDNKNMTYYKPYNPFGDERREMCAKTEYKDLPDDEKEKDLLIAKFIMEKL